MSIGNEINRTRMRTREHQREVCSLYKGFQHYNIHGTISLCETLELLTSKRKRRKMRMKRKGLFTSNESKKGQRKKTTNTTENFHFGFRCCSVSRGLNVVFTPSQSDFVFENGFINWIKHTTSSVTQSIQVN